MKSFGQIMFLIYAGIFLSLVGCAHSVHQVHVLEAAPYAEYEAGEVVKASTSQFVPFFFVFETDYVDRCYQKLVEQCPNGYITSVTTRFLTSLGFLSWTNKIEMEGLCLKKRGKSALNEPSSLRPVTIRRVSQR